MRTGTAKGRPGNGRRRAVFTIVSCNYIAYAATLMQSVRAFHPEVARYIVLADAFREFNDIDLAAELLPCEEIGIELLDNLKLWYSILEFNTAIKPFIIKRFFEQNQFDEIVFLDPDIMLFQPMTEVFAGLRGHNIVLTPHINAPLQDGRHPSELSIMKSGVYNLGFLAIRNDQHSRALLDWWADRCFHTCRVDIPGNMFTDQRWMDLAPAFVPRPLLLRHEGYNVAYWNLLHRKIHQRDDGVWFANSVKLVFFHFSGISPDDLDVFSRHQNRFDRASLGAAAGLCDLYRARLMANDWETSRTIRYMFNEFPDGRPIEEPMRRWLRRAIDTGRLNPYERLAVNSTYFDQPDSEAAEKGAVVTRFMYQYWLMREDLQRALDIFTPKGCEDYAAWFTSGEARRQGVDGRTVAAAGRLFGKVEPEYPGAQSVALLPWLPARARVWNGAARDAARFLEGDIEVTLEGEHTLVPLHVALLWEARADLKRHFPLRDPDSLHAFITWSITARISEGTTGAQHLSAQFVEQMARRSRLADYYGDVPVTQGMIITRLGGEAAKGYEARRRFPVWRPGRLAQGLWYAYIAPRKFDWPSEMFAGVRAWFDERSDLSCDGFFLTRAMMAIWELREDVQRTYPLNTEESRRLYMHWLVVHGLDEMNLLVEDMAGLRDFLLSGSPEFAGLERIYVLIYRAREDLQVAFDIRLPAGRRDLIDWANTYLLPDEGRSAVAELLRPAKQPQEVAVEEIVTAAVALTGQWNAPTGRGEDLRSSAASLLAVGFDDFVVVALDSATVLRADGSVLPDGTIVQVDVNVVHHNVQTALDDWCRLQAMNIRAQTTVGFWAWELERLPSYWRSGFSFYDEIWASTQFAEKAFSKEKLRPVRRMPMAVLVPPVTRAVSRREFNLPEDATVFLFVFDFHSFASRKNPEGVVRAFLQAFPSGEENVRLVIKTMGGYAHGESFLRLSDLCTDKRIMLRDVTMAQEELVGLMRVSDSFVSLHRSEGFGRGVAEAMLLGKPVIATGYSGTADFVSPECAYVVKYQLVPVAPDVYPGVERQRWAEPNVAQAAAHMRRVHENRDEARRIGELARARIMHLYGPHVVGAAMLEAIDALSGRPRRATGTVLVARRPIVETQALGKTMAPPRGRRRLSRNSGVGSVARQVPTAPS